MAHILKNQHLEIQMDLPLESYHFSRFDWTGKIVSVRYKNICVTGFEILNETDDTTSGKGLYNEFGIDAALGFAQTKVGDWFHKIGIGLLKKESDTYLQSRTYTIQPATFTTTNTPDALIITCESPDYNGYAYVLKKEIRLMESAFMITYFLKNTGEKIIQTDEYNHNFLAIDKELIGKDYLLKFPFYLQPKQFAETVNREGKVKIGEKEFTFIGTPSEPFFFSNLSGSKNVDASWELINTKTKIKISETGSFKTNKVNLWGNKHVISPELFFAINVEPGQETTWSRTYRISEVH